MVRQVDTEPRSYLKRPQIREVHMVYRDAILRLHLDQDSIVFVHKEVHARVGMRHRLPEFVRASRRKRSPLLPNHSKLLPTYLYFLDRQHEPCWSLTSDRRTISS